MAGIVIGFDTSVILRLVEGIDAVRLPIERRLQAVRQAGLSVVVSRLARLECRCKPLREKNTELLALDEAFFTSQEVLVKDIDDAVVERATELRAQHGLKTPDAIHAATALISGASALWTTDRSFLKIPDLAVELFVPV